MIRETGIVTAVDGDNIEVASQLKTGCSGCSQRNTCGAGLLSKAFPNRTSTLKLHNPGEFTPGQQVELQMAETTMAGYSLLLYGAPLLSLLLGAGLGQWASGGSELAAIGAGFGAFGLSFAILKRWLAGRHLQVQSLLSVHPTSSETAQADCPDRQE